MLATGTETALNPMPVFARCGCRDKRGWWVFLFLLVPVLAFVIGALAPDLGAELTWSGIAIVAILGVWALIELGVLSGTAGPNRYGSAPSR